MIGNFGSGHALVAEFVVEIGVGLVEVVADFLKDCLGVCPKNRVLATLDQGVVEFCGVGHVEISHDHEGACRPVAAAEIGMAGTFVELSAGAVAQVSHQDFPTEVEFGLHAIGVVLIQPTLAVHLEKGLHFLTENLCKGVGLNPTAAVDIWFADGHIQFHAADSSAILSAVVLLFH